MYIYIYIIHLLFQILALLNSAAVNTSFQINTFVCSFFTFPEVSTLFSIDTEQSTAVPTVNEGSLFPTALTALIVSCLFLYRSKHKQPYFQIRFFFSLHMNELGFFHPENWSLEQGLLWASKDFLGYGRSWSLQFVLHQHSQMCLLGLSCSFSHIFGGSQKTIL